MAAWVLFSLPILLGSLLLRSAKTWIPVCPCDMLVTYVEHTWKICLPCNHCLPSQNYNIPSQILFHFLCSSLHARASNMSRKPGSASISENKCPPTLMKVILYPLYFQKVFNSDIISQKHYLWFYTKELYHGRASVPHCIISPDKKLPTYQYLAVRILSPSSDWISISSIMHCQSTCGWQDSRAFSTKKNAWQSLLSPLPFPNQPLFGCPLISHSSQIKIIY